MENIAERPPLPPPRKYVSIFRINGEPILPPLMTAEKRVQMQQLKKKALLIEQRLSEHKHQELGQNFKHIENIKSDNISKCSQDNDECRLKETVESMALLKTLLIKQREEDKSEEILESSSSSPIYLNENKSEEKIQKLQKSETLIYDNSSNQDVKVPNENKTNSYDTHGKQPINMGNSQNKNRSQLLLAGTNIKGISAIPTICLNPPTPLTVDKNLCDSLSAAESSESAITSENPNQSLDFSHELSSDESNESMLTHSDKKPYRRILRNNIKIVRDGDSSRNIVKKPLTAENNIYANVKMFEAISSDTNTPETSPEKVYKNRKLCLGSLSGTMSRSATSPSIKLSNSNRSSSYRSQSLIQDSDNSPESNLTRSSSFTLDGPSKALIDHMQQQKVISQAKVELKSSSKLNQNPVSKPLTAPLRAHRDTVESKAKKVQKLEFKSSKPNTQPKGTQSKLSLAAAASKSPYHHQYTNNVCKTKRSPSHKSPQTVHKPFSPQTHKSNSTLNFLNPNKLCTPSLCGTVLCTSSRKPQPGSEPFHDLELKKAKFLKLLALQEQEHRRLQLTFKLQQQILIEQLNREIASNNNSHNSSQQKQFAEQKKSPPRQLNHNQSLQKSSAFSQHQSPILISSSNSFSAFDKKPTPNENSHQNLSFGSNPTQSIQPIVLNNSNLSLMDHLNNNTFSDISKLSMQTTPAISLVQNNSAKNAKTTPSFCRRLFTTEINDAFNSRSVANASRSVGNTSTEYRNQPQLLNHDSKRRASKDNLCKLHEAATKINAFARGFLVRRLFKTEKIQRIVQTIRDTLIFVLNLHIETIEHPEELQTLANIKLKARLLQQLSAACRTIHFVFFQCSIKDRMETIARDRQRIKNKLMANSRKRTSINAALKEDKILNHQQNIFI